MEISSEECGSIIAAATAAATALEATVSVAVVDAGGNLKAFLRMDGAEIAGPTIAVDKAFTAVANQTATHLLAEQAAPGGPLFGLHTCGAGRFVIFGGGIPITQEGLVVGGIGVSGGTVDEDVVCATEGARSAEVALLHRVEKER